MGVLMRECDHYIEFPEDPWTGTYCKLPAGHDGPHSAHYPKDHSVADMRREGELVNTACCPIHGERSASDHGWCRVPFGMGVSSCGERLSSAEERARRDVDRAARSEGIAIARVDATEARRMTSEGCPSGACWCGSRTQDAEQCEALIDGHTCRKPVGHPCHHLFRA